MTARLEVVLGGEERQRRCRVEHERDRRQLARGRRCDRDESAQDVGRRRQQDRPAEDHADRIEPVLEAGDDAEVAAAAANRPEQVGVLGLAGDQLAPVGGHDLDRDERIDREAVLADEPADAAAEGQPGDADRAGVAERRGQAMGGGRLGELDRGQAGLCPGNPRIGVDVQAAHVGEVEDDAAVDGAVAGEAVAAAADRELELVVAGERDGPCNVARVGRADDRERSGVDCGLVHLAGGLVFVVARQDHAAGQAAGERVEIHRLVNEGAAQDPGFQGVVLLVGVGEAGVCVSSNLRRSRCFDSRRQADAWRRCPSRAAWTSVQQPRFSGLPQKPARRSGHSRSNDRHRPAQRSTEVHALTTLEGVPAAGSPRRPRAPRAPRWRVATMAGAALVLVGGAAIAMAASPEPSTAPNP